MSRLLQALAVSGCLVLSLAPGVGAFETVTHIAINQRAARASTVDAVLRAELGFLGGADTPLIDRRTPVDWIGLGGRAEDMWLDSETLGGLTRSTNHFHTPLRPWDSAGLVATSEASVRWAQNRTQAPGTRASWFDARAAFHRALTTVNPAERQRSFADAFLYLGQVMHLVADLASVAHTRDDPHPGGDPFEAFMSRPENIGRFVAGISRPDSGLVRAATGDAVATVPIARLWDADLYDGTNPPDAATSPLFGLAEFASANFFSGDTITRVAFANPDLPLPALDRLVSGPVEIYPPTGKLRQYLSKPGDGVPVTHMVAEGVFTQFTPPFVRTHTLDDLVLADYAGHLLPRAVGYASALVDYFLRGRLQIAPPSRFAYGLAAWVPGNAGAFTRLTFKVRNATPGEDTGEGDVVAVVRYRRSTAGDVLQNPAAPLTEPFYAVSAPQRRLIGRDFQELTFDFSANPIPTNSADVFLTVVYRGPLGLETTEAVAVGGKDLKEPDFFDRANITDYDCFQGTPFQVALGGEIMPPYRFPDQTQRDVDGDRVQDLFGPWTERGVFLKTFDLTGPIPGAGPGNVDEETPVLDHARFSRYVLLQDADFYGMAVLRQQLTEFSTATTFFNLREAGAIQGIVNHLFQVGPFLVHEYNLSFTYRGLTTYRLFLLLSSPEMNFCLNGSDTLTPALTQAPDIVTP